MPLPLPFPFGRTTSLALGLALPFSFPFSSSPSSGSSSADSSPKILLWNLTILRSCAGYNNKAETTVGGVHDLSSLELTSIWQDTEVWKSAARQFRAALPEELES